jgi:undecaprenyl pyrophosphate synthase
MLLKAALYVAESGRKRRGLPKEHGHLDSICMRADRWAKADALDRVFHAVEGADGRG